MPSWHDFRNSLAKYSQNFCPLAASASSIGRLGRTVFDSGAAKIFVWASGQPSARYRKPMGVSHDWPKASTNKQMPSSHGGGQPSAERMEKRSALLPTGDCGTCTLADRHLKRDYVP
jgi:hypothetical protein